MRRNRRPGDARHLRSCTGRRRTLFLAASMPVRRDDDDALTIKVGMRSDLPRQHMQRLPNRLETVRARLLAEHPGSASDDNGSARSATDRSEIAAVATSSVRRGSWWSRPPRRQLDEAAIAAYRARS